MPRPDDDTNLNGITGIGAKIFRIGTNLVHSNPTFDVEWRHFLSSITQVGGPDNEMKMLLTKLGLSFNADPLSSPLGSTPRIPGKRATFRVLLGNHEVAVAQTIADLEKSFRNKTLVDRVLRMILGPTLVGPISSARKDVLNETLWPKLTYPTGTRRIPDVFYKTWSWLNGSTTSWLDIKRGAVSPENYGGHVRREAYADAENLARLTEPGRGLRKLGQFYRVAGAGLTGVGLAYDIYEAYKTGDYSQLASTSLFRGLCSPPLDRSGHVCLEQLDFVCRRR
jgi:hypothetical protein